MTMQLDAFALRDQALDRLTAKYGNVVQRLTMAMHLLWVERTKTGKWLKVEPTVSADDAAEWLDAHGFTGERRVAGAVFGPAKGWRRVGFVPSRLPRRHGRPIPLWTWVGRKEKTVL